MRLDSTNTNCERTVTKKHQPHMACYCDACFFEEVVYVSPSSNMALYISLSIYVKFINIYFSSPLAQTRHESQD